MVEGSDYYFNCGDDMGSTGLKLGDLVTLKHHCKDSNRMAIVVSLARFDPGYVFIAFTDDPTKRVFCALGNIIKLN
tara:strand:- start:266 stop:493 length:228 start_codon:yes stop_codon:yes gene_type:complete